jgi:hypothetical protein
MNVRFGAHNGLNSGTDLCPKSAQKQIFFLMLRVTRLIGGSL